MEHEALRCRQVVSSAELQAQRSLLEELRRPRPAPVGRRSALGAVESMEQATERLMAACERLQPKDGAQLVDKGVASLRLGCLGSSGM